MPVARYFLFVGGVLLALLFGLNVFSPEQAVVASNVVPSVDKTDKTIVRIHSDQKLPERVVYDTSLTTIVPPKAATVEAAVMPPAPATNATAQAHLRDTLAQLVPAAEPRKPEPQVQRKRKIAKIRSAPTVRFAQQPQQQFGFFGGPIWRNAW